MSSEWRNVWYAGYDVMDRWMIVESNGEMSYE